MKTRRKAYSELTNELAALPKANVFTGHNTFKQGIDVEGEIGMGSGTMLAPEYLKLENLKGDIVLVNYPRTKTSGTYTFATLDDIGGYTYIDKTINGVISTSATTPFTQDEMTQIFNNYSKTIIHLTSSEGGAGNPVEKFLYPYGKVQGTNFFIFISPVYSAHQYVLTITGTAGTATIATITKVSVGSSGGGGTAGVSSIGGATGAITLDNGLTIANNKLTPKIKNIYVAGGFLNIETN